MKKIALLPLFLTLCAAVPAGAQVIPPLPEIEKEQKGLTFSDTPLDMVLDEYARMTGKTIIKAPNVPQLTITLKSQGKLDAKHVLLAIESKLALNSITLTPEGERVLRALSQRAAKLGMQMVPIAQSD